MEVIEKNILITGAASGIGCAAAIKFAKEGYNVYALDVKRAQGSDCITSIEADITDASALRDVACTFGRDGVEFDAIICAAGVHTMAALAESEFAEMKRIIDINLL